MERFGYSENDLARGVVDERFRRLMRFEVDRAEALFRQGMPLARRLRGMARLDIALFSKGGMSVLDAIRLQHYDVLTHRPTVSSARKVWLMLSTAAKVAATGRP